MLFVFRLYLRPRRPNHPAWHTRVEGVGQEAGVFRLRVAGLPRWNGRMMSENEREVKQRRIARRGRTEDQWLYDQDRKQGCDLRPTLTNKRRAILPQRIQKTNVGRDSEV